MARPKTTGRSYAHKPYMNSTGYPASMARPGDKDYDAYQKRPHSDDKKPYMDDEYPEMEHYWTPYDPPNFIPPGIPDDPRIPPMNPNQPPDIEGGPDKPPGESDFTGCIWGIPQGPLTIFRGETTFHGIATPLNDPLVRLYINYGPLDMLSTVKQVNTCIASIGSNCIVSVRAKANFNPDDYHEITENLFVCQVVGRTESGWECAWDLFVLYCPADEEFEWDYDNSAETIGDNDSVALYVTGGAPPFTWAVEGEGGFSLEYQVTQERHNTLSSDENTACGSAKITVIDGCESVVQAGIRNADRGSWVSKGEICGLAIRDSSGAWARSGLTYGDTWSWTGEAILGYQRQTQVLQSKYGGAFASQVGSFPNESECDAHRYSFNLGTLLVDSCLTWESPLYYGSTGYGGTYYRIAERKYARNCTFSQRLYDLGMNAWSYLFSHFAVEPAALNYYEWEC